MKINWLGEKLKAKMRDAERYGVDRVMAECVVEAKLKHDNPGGPAIHSVVSRSAFKSGWNNVTSTAEGSIRITAFAQTVGQTVRGTWGSADVEYFIQLEIFHGSILRRTADAMYPRLTKYILEKFKSA